jgi:hypothetical protein
VIVRPLEQEARVRLYFVLAAGLAEILFIFIGGLAFGGAGDPAKEPSAKFKIMTKKKDDTVKVHVEKDRTVFVVHSPSGISQAVVERQDADWPKAVMLRLHLKGLESFRASSGKVTLDASVALRDGKPTVRIWKDGKEDAPLDKKSPLWMDIRLLGADGKPADALPLKDGYFEMTLPRAFFQGNPQSITLAWIDFYR